MPGITVDYLYDSLQAAGVGLCMFFLYFQLLILVDFMEGGSKSIIAKVAEVVGGDQG